MMHNGMSNL